MKTNYKPSELKFSATYNGEIVKAGDYWLPDERAGYWNCYPVRISSMGIHYTRKLKPDSEHITCSDGRTYYDSWESECIQSEGVSLSLTDAETT